MGRVGESVSFVTGYAVQAADGSSAEPQVSAGIAEAAASIDNAGCAPEDLDCMHATIGEVATGGEDSASVQTVPYWDGHVRAWQGWWGRSREARVQPPAMLTHPPLPR